MAQSLKESITTHSIPDRRESLGIAFARQKFALNLSSNILFTVVNIVANFLLTPFLIARLGIAAFGMIPLVNTITSYMAVFTTALDTSVSRYLTIDLEQRNYDQANRTFNSSLFGVLGILLILSLAAFAISSAFPALFNIPANSERDVRLLFLSVAFGFFISVIGGVFSISPFVYSQFLLINAANFAGLLVKVGSIVLLFLILPARLWYSGVGTLLGAVITLLIFIALWRKLTPELHIRLKAFDWHRLASLLEMGSWLVISTAGAMLLSRVDLFVVNGFFGAALTGAYGSVAQLSTLMETMVNTVSGLLRPVLFIQFAQGNFESLKRVTFTSIKLLGYALALPAGLLCGFSVPLLSLWLGPDYTYLSLLVVVLISHFSLNYSVRPLLLVQNAYNKVRWPGIATLIAGIANLVLAILVARWGKLGYLGVALVGAVVWTCKNSLYMSIYTARVMHAPWWTFFPGLSSSLISTAAVGLASYGLTMIWMPKNVITLAAAVGAVSLLYTLLVWLIGLNPADRKLLYELSPVKFPKPDTGLKKLT